MAITSVNIIIKGIIGYLLFVVLTGCSVFHQNILFQSRHEKTYYRERTKKDIPPIVKLRKEGPQVDSSGNVIVYQYRIQIDDQISIRLMNESVDAGNTALVDNATTRYSPYKVDANGYIYLPTVGKVYVLNKTILELRHEIENKYREFIRDPVIEVTVPSMVAYLFADGTQSVVKLPRERTHLLQVIASAGGVSATAKAKKVKIIRGNLNNPQIIWVNLTKLEGLGSEDLIVRANDIIYIQPREVQLAVREIQPYLTLFNIITFLASFYFILGQFGVIR
jgi:polysaccharide export outer membrane protein